MLLAVLLLAGTVSSVKFLDLNDLAVAQSLSDETPAPLLAPLALPSQSIADDDVAPVPTMAADAKPAPVEEHSVPMPAVAATSGSTAQAVAEPVQAVEEPAADEHPATLAGIAVDTRPSLLEGDSASAAPAPVPADTTIAESHEQPPAPIEPVDSAAAQWVEHEVAKGESLARIFAAQGLEAALLHRIVNADPLGRKLARVRPGQTFRFRFDDDRELTRLELHRNRIESIHVAISDDIIDIDEVSKDVDVRIASAAGVIESSLFVDGQRSGLSDGKIMDLAEIFGWDIDFALEIRAGDRFRMLYEEHYLDGEKLRDGEILAAEFTNRGNTHTAVRFEDKQGEVSYYDDDGNSKRRAFIRTPIKFARISSRYNPRRWHPVLKKWRAHKGVDYAAPKGTPIKATGDGRVVFRGSKSGYGKTVIIEHASKYTTLYAHMSGYSRRSAVGKRVKQGQVIGYVGKTGLATGPHLHYEFRVNGVHRDPLRVKLPKSLSLAKSEMKRFRETTAPLLTRLAAIPSATMVASADEGLTR